MCLKSASWHTWNLQAKFSMTFSHSSLEINFIVDVISVSRQEYFWVVGIHPSFKISSEIKIWGFTFCEYGDQCGLNSRLISRSKKGWFIHYNDSFELCCVAPSCWNQWQTLTTNFCRPSAVQNLRSSWTISVYCHTMFNIEVEPEWSYDVMFGNWVSVL